MSTQDELASSDQPTAVVFGDESLDGPYTDPGADQDAPTKVGRYILLTRVGKGGMGTVYSAFDPELERQVAVKLMNVSAGQERLRREAQAIAQVSHRNVIAVYDVGYYEHQGALGLYMVMALIDGEDLSAWLAAEARSWEQIVEVFAQAGRGLAAAHAQGVIHRDLKPSNVLIDRDGTAHVLDFGLARAVDITEAQGPSASASALLSLPLRPDDTASGSSRSVQSASSSSSGSSGFSSSGNSSSGFSSSGFSSSGPASSGSMARTRSSLTTQLTQHGTVMGTPRFMSPEQHSTHAVDALSDQYSFCLTLYLALYDRYPFAKEEREGMRELVRAKRKGIQAWDGAEVPEHLRALMRRGLALDPRERWPDMPSLVAALVDDPSRRRRRRLRAGGLAAAAFFAIGAGLSWDARSMAACDAQDAWIQAAWADTQRASVQAAFSGVELSYASVALASTQTKLDSYARALTGARAQLCRDAHRQRLDASVHSARQTCLDESRERLGAVVERLVRADATAVAHAIDVLATLPPIARCLALESAASPGPDPEVQAEIERELFAAQLSMAEGHQDQALEAIALVVERARALDDPLTLALATVRAAAIYGSARDSETSEALANEGTLLAVRLGAHDLAIDGLTSLAKTLSDRRGRWDDAQRSLDLARAKYAREPGGRVGEWYFPYIQSALHRQHGRKAESVTSLRRALELLGVDAEPMDRAKVLQALAASENYNKQSEAAAEHLRESIQIRLDLYGADHPNLMYPYRTQARLLASAGDHEAALARLDRVVELGARHLGADAAGMLEPYMERAQQLRSLQRLAEADAAYARARSCCSGAGQSCGNVLRLQAQVALRMGQPQRALELAESALDEEREHLGPDEQFPWLRARFIMHRGEALLALERAQEAVAAFELATRLREQGKRDALLVRIWVGEAEAYLLLAQPERAREAYARAHEHLELPAHETTDDIRGRLRWGQAKLAANPQQRAQQAERARAAFEAHGDAQLSEDFAAWLAIPVATR